MALTTSGSLTGIFKSYVDCTGGSPEMTVTSVRITAIEVGSVTNDSPP